MEKELSKYVIGFCVPVFLIAGGDWSLQKSSPPPNHKEVEESWVQKSRSQPTDTDVDDSHFGIHIGDYRRDYSTLHSSISELGNIYVRHEVWGDLYGWKRVKKGVVSNSILASRELCEKYCDPKRSSSDPENVRPSSYYCETGELYFCRPDTREGMIKWLPHITDFLENPKNLSLGWFLTVATSRYDKKPPKDFPAGAYPYGNEGTYREYIEYLIRQLGSQVKYWQIGNENDFSKFWVGTPKEYAKMLTIASQAIKGHSQGSKVGISFASPRLEGKRKWFDAMKEVGDTFDFIDLHYYIPHLIEQGTLEEWKKAFPEKEFISTETGVLDVRMVWKGVDPQVGGTKQKQAEDLIKYATALFQAGYKRVFFYLYDHDFVPGTDDPWEHMGLITEHSEKKPSFDAYKTLIRKVDRFAGIEKLDDGQYVYTFHDKGPVYVLWSDSKSGTGPPGLKGMVKITDYLGNERIMLASKIVLTQSPVFVEATAATR